MMIPSVHDFLEILFEFVEMDHIAVCIAQSLMLEVYVMRCLVKGPKCMKVSELIWWQRYC